MDREKLYPFYEPFVEEIPDIESDLTDTELIAIQDKIHIENRETLEWSSDQLRDGSGGVRNITDTTESSRTIEVRGLRISSADVEEIADMFEEIDTTITHP